MVSNGRQYVCVIGAAAVDLSAVSFSKLVATESNPGKLHTSWGGVARNIAHNLARLDVDAKLLTILGDDAYSKRLRGHCEAEGIELIAEHTEEASMPAYLSVIEPQGEMSVAVSDMSLLETFDISMIKANADTIRNAAICVIDTNLPSRLIDYLFEAFPDTDFCVDLVSIKKAGKVEKWLHRIAVIKPNRAEAAHLSAGEVDDHAPLDDILAYYLRKGVGQVFVSLGAEGLHFADKKTQGKLVAERTKLINVTGAGDAMMAGIIYARLHGQDLRKTAHIAMAAAQIAVQYNDAVNPAMSVAALEKAMENISDA